MGGLGHGLGGFVDYMNWHLGVLSFLQIVYLQPYMPSSANRSTLATMYMKKLAGTAEKFPFIDGPLSDLSFESKLAVLRRDVSVKI